MFNFIVPAPNKNPLASASAAAGRTDYIDRNWTEYKTGQVIDAFDMGSKNLLLFWSKNKLGTTFNVSTKRISVRLYPNIRIYSTIEVSTILYRLAYNNWWNVYIMIVLGVFSFGKFVTNRNSINQSIKSIWNSNGFHPIQNSGLARPFLSIQTDYFFYYD